MQQNALIEQLEKEAEILAVELAEHREQREFHTRKESEKVKALHSLRETIGILKARFGSSDSELNSPISTPYEQKPFIFESKNESREQPSTVARSSNEATPTPMPDDLRRPEWKHMNLGQILEQLCPKMHQPFTRDDLVPKVYDTKNEEEWSACGRSMNAALSRAVQSGFLVREGRGSFVVAMQKVQPILDVHRQSSMVESFPQ